MKIFVKAKPNAREQRIQKFGEAHFVVAVQESPFKGKANQAIIRALAEHFKIPAFKIKLVRGFKEKNKIFEIDEF